MGYVARDMLYWITSTPLLRVVALPKARVALQNQAVVLLIIIIIIQFNLFRGFIR